MPPQQPWPALDGFWEAVAAADLVLSQPLADHWDAPSVLPELSVGDLAAHLVRGVSTVVTYLAAGPAPNVRDVASTAAQPVPVSATQYVVTLLPEPADVMSPTNEGIRQRSKAEAVGGHPAVLARWRDVVAQARDALDRHGKDHQLVVAGELVITLDEYLRTRVVELVVHTDDLALSAGVDPPEPAPQAAAIAAHALIDIARARHGDLAAVRAMARRERGPCEALRAL